MKYDSTVIEVMGYLLGGWNFIPIKSFFFHHVHTDL
jgi:hypothetical protein